MLASFGWAALALLFSYLALFFWGSAIAAQAALRLALGDAYDRDAASVPRWIGASGKRGAA
jgi:hypothetical protein